MNREELLSRVAHLKQSLTSASKCSPAILESLFLLLNPNATQGIIPKPHTKGKDNKIHNSVSRAAGKPSGRLKKKAEVVVLEVVESPKEQLSSGEKLKLGLEVVNATLKGLTEVLKNPATTKIKQETSRTPSVSLSDRGLDPRASKPLQPRCVNEVSSGLSGNTCRRCSSLTSKNQISPAVHALAECARLAFATIRKLAPQSGTPLPHLQLELGMSALVNKLIALELDDLAVKELRILLKRILPNDGAHGSSHRPKGQSRSKGSEEVPKNQRLTDLLRITEIPSDPLILDLIVCSQVQIIKIIALRKQISSIEDAHEHLQRSASYSPINLLGQLLASPSHEVRRKGAKNLEILVQVLQSLCHSLSVEQPGLISGLKQYHSPQTTLKYHLLAVEARCMLWKQSGQVGDLHRELFKPFKRFLATFARRSDMSELKTYTFAKETFDLFFELWSGLPAVPSTQEQGGLVEIYRILGDLAAKSKRFEDAAQFLRMSLSALAKDSGSSKVQECVFLCRLASIYLQDEVEAPRSLTTEETITALQDAIFALGEDIQVSSTDFVDLLLTSAELRKVACIALFNHIKATEDLLSSVIPQLDNLCFEVVLLSLTILMRYLREEPRATLSCTNASTVETRLEQVAQVVRPTLEAVVSLSKVSFAHSSNRWQKLDKSLQDCVVLLGYLNRQILTWRQPPYALLSNAYWYHYIHQVQAKEDPANMKPTLEKSIALVKEGSESDSAGTLLCTKLERLAGLYKVSNDAHKARDLYHEALQAFVREGSFRKVTEAAAARPWPMIQKENSSASFISRVLFQYLKLVRHDPSTCFFDDGTLLPEDRGLLLEAQLIILIPLMGNEVALPNSQKAVRLISEILLEIYAVDRFPIRRLRVCVGLLHANSLYQGLLSTSLMDELIGKTIAPKEPSIADSTLGRFVPHILACQEAFSAIWRNPPDINSLQHSLDTWSALVAGCNSLAALCGQVEDTQLWLVQLSTIADFLDMQGLVILRAKLLYLVTEIQKLQSQSQQPSYLCSLINLGLQLTRLGYSEQAGTVLQRVETHLDSVPIEDPIMIEWHLAFSEHLLLTGNGNRSARHIEQARNLMTSTTFTAKMISKDVNYQDRQLLWSMDYMHLLSQLSLSESQSSQALFCARRSVRLAYDFWAILNRRSAKMKSMDASNTIDSLVEDVSGLKISKDRKPTLDQEIDGGMQSAMFWPLVPRLFRQLSNIASIYAHEGNIPQALYYCEQSAKVAKAAKARLLEAQVNAVSSDIDLRRGCRDGGSGRLARSIEVLHVPTATQAGIIAQMALAGEAIRKSDHTYSSQLLDTALKTIDAMLSNPAIKELHRVGTDVNDIEIQMKRVTIQPQKPEQNVRRKRPQMTKSIKEPVQASVVLGSASTTSEWSPLHQIRIKVLQKLAICALEARKLDTAHQHAVNAQSPPFLDQETIHNALVMAQITLYRALDSIVRHPLLSVLPDSAVACPSAVYDSHLQKKECVDECVGIDSHAQTKKSKGKTVSKAREKKMLAENNPLDELLWKAFAALKDVHQVAQAACSLPTLHQLADVFTRIVLMLSAACPTAPQAAVCPTLAVYAMELGRSSAISRDKFVIEAENRLLQQGQLSLDVDWEVFRSLPNSASYAMDVATFQSDYIDIIPPSWTVVTMSINEARNELRLAKLRANQTPFVVMIPLSRHAPDGDDDESFGFDEGKAELQDIISAANTSSQSALCVSKKGAKTAWWDERTALDARLKDLLMNIENIWFGGFRGLFSQLQPRHDLLSRFNSSFTNILNNHLPSRQKASKLPASAYVSLDARVMELFVALGNPNEVADLDEPLTDLLNFVVDVLQFNGERNAYDEIDFDSIAVETLDALKQYHQAMSEYTADGPACHTILVLDKALHCFPWESLPCMTGQAISRLPSLRSLRLRLIGESKHGEKSSGEFCIDSKDGAFILNPGGDLINTEATFRNHLSNLTTWSQSINTIPTEEEIASYLNTKSLYLYFGHGSGGQYIRSRAIRKLDRCAVALLMGCSSAALIEEGEFESHGMPLNYLQAGSQAVVGTLWDVTDKDIDRFSVDVLERWGLLDHAEDENVSPVKKGGKSKGRIGAKTKKTGQRSATSGKGNVSLDQAVGAARDTCILRYLNGAAPVVYGVPVYLS
jgi:separase